MNKLSKSKTIGIAAMSLAAVAVASVGFSAWIAVSKSDDQVSGVTVEVADVLDGSVTVKGATVTYPNSGTKIVFDADSKNQGKFLTAKDSKLNLDFTLTFTYNVGTDATYKGIAAYMTVNKKAGSEFDTNKVVSNVADGDKQSYICCPLPLTETSKATLIDIAGAKNENGAALTKGTDQTFTKNYSFSWGGLFEKKNPSAADSQGKADTYKKALKEIQDAELTYKITITVAE